MANIRSRGASWFELRKLLRIVSARVSELCLDLKATVRAHGRPLKSLRLQLRDQQAQVERVVKGEAAKLARRQLGVAELARTYATDAIAVEWEPKLCIHTENCVRGLPQVF